MEHLDHQQLPSLHLQDTTQPPGHWNDRYFIAAGEPVALRSGYESKDHQTAAEKHLEGLWKQEQVLLGMAISRIEGSPDTPSIEELKALEIPARVADKSSALVSELYRRMGAINDMGYSDLLLTSLAGLVVEEVAAEKVPGFGSKYRNRGEPFEKSFAYIGAFAGMLVDQPELVDGRESDMLLTAELLSEALRSPEDMRHKLGEVAGIDADSLESEFYARHIVQICDAVIARTKTNALIPTDGISSRKAHEKREKAMSYLQTAILTKYDVLFDMVEAGPTEETSQDARELLAHFIAEAAEVIDHEDLGRAYELFSPIVFRYAALASGAINVARIWHSSARADLPLDKFGFKPDKSDNPYIEQHIQKQSSDVQIGRAVDGGRNRGFGRVTERLQLKARSDAEGVLRGYDQKSVGFHFQDAVNLLAYVGGLLQDSDSGYKALTDKFDPNDPGKENIKELAAKQVVWGLLGEISRRIKGGGAESNHEFVLKGVSTEIRVDLSKILDELVLPVYRRMVDAATGTRSNSSVPREVVGVK